MNLYYTKQIKNGKWRLYQIEAQAFMSWRGDNDKTTVVRDANNTIITTRTREELVELCQQRFKTAPLQESEVD